MTGTQRPWQICTELERDLAMLARAGLTHSWWFQPAERADCVVGCSCLNLSHWELCFPNPLPCWSQGTVGQKWNPHEIWKAEEAGAIIFCRSFWGYIWWQMDNTYPHSALHPILPDRWPCWPTAALSLPPAPRLWTIEAAETRVSHRCPHGPTLQSPFNRQNGLIPLSD